MSEAVYVLAGARTPQTAWSRGKKGDGTPGGALKGVDVFDLGAIPLKAAVQRSGVAPDRIEALAFGHAYHSHVNNCYGSRYIGLRAGLPDSVPCLGFNIGCGTALQAIGTGAQMIRDGQAQIVAAGGSESTSAIGKEVLFPSFHDLAAGEAIGKTVEDLAAYLGVTRAEADAWALRSHAHALLARRGGRFAAEIVPVGEVTEDDAIQAEPALDRFAAAKATYGGIVSSLNSHALVDGGGAVILAGEEGAKAAKPPPLGRFVAWSVAGVSPKEMAFASVPAIRSVLEKARWKQEEVDLFEVNETFAAQLLVVQKALKIPSEKLNVNGGAVALGHPFGATGARLVLTLLMELRRRKLQKGVAAICVGGGQGVAAAVEVV